MSKKFIANSRRKPFEYEKALVEQWNKQKTFEKSVEQRPVDNSYVFYDGPPFITGVPHHGTLLSSIVKDAIPRYQTMNGKRVERRWGWDCHGLPAEVFTEKKLGIQDKRDIGTKISLEEYITTCRDNMVQTGNLWEDTIDRIGRWVNFKGAYKTMDKEYMESVWWAFKELYEKGKIYEGEKVLLYCTRDATPISKAEVAMDNSYQDVTDPSVYVKFRLLGDEVIDSEDVLEGQNLDDEEYEKELARLNERKKYPVFLLAWTTTPWTLPSNSAIAVNKKLTYVEVLHNNEILIMAKSRVEAVMTDEKHQPLEYKIVRELKGEELTNRAYTPLFYEKSLERKAYSYQVWHADFVTDEQGTGIAHESPAYGEEDYLLANEYKFPWVMSTDEDGIFTIGPWKGKNVWEVNKQIAKDMHLAQGQETSVEDSDYVALEKKHEADHFERVDKGVPGQWRGSVWKIEYIRHEYPHCHRCGTKLMYRAHPSWFMDIDGQRTEMLEANGNVNWFPEHIKHGRSEKTIQTAPDWNLSRDRFWATAMPVWKAVDKAGNEHVKVIGCYEELKELSGKELDDYHRPWIDDISFEIDGLTYTRIEKVLDCWFESGSMPFAQYHYPFENKQKFEANFPGDFIVEYVGQVRAWFYYMNAVNIGLFGQRPFKNVIVTGSVMGNDGKKLSKSLGNYTDPNIVMDQYSADALRFTLLNSPLLNGEDFTLKDKDINDNARKLSMIWNMYDFFTMYAEVDKWEWGGDLSDPTPQLKNPLDLWITARVHQLNDQIHEHMDNYDVPNAMKPILPFIDDASNWYVRRSRRRFWKSDDDSDKQDAYRTLHYVLVQLSMLLAPFTPFLAEELYQQLTDGESVHLLDWPAAGHIDELIVKEMAEVRDHVNEGLSERAKNQLKVRQPLASVTVPNLGKTVDFESILKDELNVKEVKQGKEFKLDLRLNDTLKREGLMREVVRHVQNARKKAGLNVDDRIALHLATESKVLRQSIDEHQATIKQETLAEEITESPQPHTQEVAIDGQGLTISLAKSSK